jgi:hypothetical protein
MEVETTSIKLRELLERFKNGEVWLPQFQRDYVWTARKVRNLLDSLWKGLPIGGFYLWYPEPRSHHRAKQGHQIRSYFDGFLIDGQQRLTSLEAAYGLYAGEDKRGAEFECYLDLSAPEISRGRDTRLFVSRAQKRSVRSRLEKGDPTLIPLKELWEADSFTYCEQVKRQLSALPGWNEDKIAVAMDRLQRALKMLEQDVPCTKLHKLDTEQAIEVFRRLNKGGVPLRESDLEATELAQEHAYDLLEQMRSFVSEERPRRIGFSFSFAFRALVLFHRESAQFKGLPPKWVTMPGPDGRSLEASWKAARSALTKAMEFVDKRMGWSRRRLVPSLNALLVLAAALDKDRNEIDEHSELLYRRWLCLTALRGTFSHSTDTTVNRFYSAVRKHKGKPAKALLLALKSYESRKITERELLAPSPPWGAPTQIIYSWLVHQEARDWFQDKPLTELVVAPAGKALMGDLTVHHIFPRELVAQLLGDPNLANTPANYALVSGETNSRLNDKWPKEALALLHPDQKAQAARQFFAPEAGDMLEPDPDACQEFWEWRARRLAKALNSWLGLD